MVSNGKHYFSWISLLAGTCQLYSEQRAVRVKRIVDRKRIGRLEPVSASDAPHGGGKAAGKSDDALLPQASRLTSTASAATLLGSNSPPKSSATSSAFPAADDDGDSTLQQPQLSDEDRQMLQLENEQLYDELNSMVDEVRQIEGRMVEISRLQEIFADNVLQQDRDINKISETVVGTTENIKDGNDEIREAMKNNAVFRIWILFFLIVCTFSLLFLDWYNA